jgi:hypothetical protein
MEFSHITPDINLVFRDDDDVLYELQVLIPEMDESHLDDWIREYGKVVPQA